MLETFDPMIFEKPTKKLGYLWVTGNNNATCDDLGARGDFPRDVVCVDDTVCDVELPYLLADGICNGKEKGYATAECMYDGNDCDNSGVV